MLKGPNPGQRVQEAPGSCGSVTLKKDPPRLLPVPSSSRPLACRRPHLQGSRSFPFGRTEPTTTSEARVRSSQVLFTGVVDEAGEQVLARLGGGVAEGVADMNCLVTDKLRRTVKLLCAVAKGIPVVTTLWLEKVSLKITPRSSVGGSDRLPVTPLRSVFQSGKTGSFLSPSAFIVKDLEQEKKFNFSLQESLKVASSQPLLQVPIGHTQAYSGSVGRAAM